MEGEVDFVLNSIAAYTYLFSSGHSSELRITD
jgi:hypothetical protein